MSYVKTQVSGVHKDQETGALVNTDGGKLQAYKRQKHMFRMLQELERKVNELEQILNTLKINEGSK